MQIAKKRSFFKKSNFKTQVITDPELIAKFNAYTPKNNHNVRVVTAPDSNNNNKSGLPKITYTFIPSYNGYFRVYMTGGGGWGYAKHLDISYNGDYLYNGPDSPILSPYQCYLYLNKNDTIIIYAQWHMVNTSNFNVDLTITGVEKSKLN